ncbi:DUF924 family protein [Prosthecomicrobium sp. N25]|uniref:DUF924 family protein n=1 Tax=Prosthecomicrobium sp. N25 TaxID=3129254 RepID=UPI00307766FA
MQPAEVIDFWRDAGPERWFDSTPDFDAACRDGFAAAWAVARGGALAAWEETPEGALALVILLDQMPRNMFRGEARTYASDPEAREVARRALARGFDTQVSDDLRRFFYLPFMHSEDIEDQRRSVLLFDALGDADSAKWARHHHDIVARFGRFPHRNALLGRSSTADEVAFLAEPGAFAGSGAISGGGQGR